jgi:hypothetical protein
MSERYRVDYSWRGSVDVAEGTLEELTRDLQARRAESNRADGEPGEGGPGTDHDDCAREVRAMAVRLP